MNCVLQYKMNEINPTATVSDNSGNGYNGSASQNTSIMHRDGLLDGCFYFNGESDYIGAIGPYFGGNSFTVSLWFKPDNMESNSAGRLIGTAFDDGWSPQTFYGWNIDIDYYGDQYNIFFTINGMDHINLTTGSLNDLISDWVFVTCIFDSITEYCHIYINGESSYSMDVSSYLSEINWDTESQSIRVGSTINDLLFFKGYIDNICIFNDVLSQEEITFLYNNGIGTESLDMNEQNENGGSVDMETWTKEIVIGGRNLKLYELSEPVIGEFDGLTKRVFSIEVIKKIGVTPVEPSRNYEFSFVWKGIRFSMSQDYDGKLYVNFPESNNPSISGIPAYELILYGMPIATDSERKIIFHDSGYSTDDIEKYEYMMIGGMPHVVGRVGNSWYWVVHPTPTSIDDLSNLTRGELRTLPSTDRIDGSFTLGSSEI